MSETESMALPPVNVLQADDHGLQSWCPQYDGLQITLGFRIIKLRAYRGEQEVIFNLSPDEARHLAGLLQAKADLFDMNEAAE